MLDNGQFVHLFCKLGSSFFAKRITYYKEMEGMVEERMERRAKGREVGEKQGLVGDGMSSSQGWHTVNSKILNCPSLYYTFSSSTVPFFPGMS